jgi:hypothetical protein
MTKNLICCILLPPATISSIPIFDFEKANEGLANLTMTHFYPCCGKFICGGCVHSFHNESENCKCPFCNSDRGNKTDEDYVEEITKRAKANDAASICVLGTWYLHGLRGLQQDRTKSNGINCKGSRAWF